MKPNPANIDFHVAGSLLRMMGTWWMEKTHTSAATRIAAHMP